MTMSGPKIVAESWPGFDAGVLTLPNAYGVWNGPTVFGPR